MYFCDAPGSVSHDPSEINNCAA